MTISHEYLIFLIEDADASPKLQFTMDTLCLNDRSIIVLLFQFVCLFFANAISI